MNYTLDPAEMLMQLQFGNLTLGMILNLTSNYTSVENLTEYKGNERDSMAVVIPGKYVKIRKCS